jgi:hypothetical protein
VSQTESLGVTDAARWVGVAASMAGYLECWLAEEQKQPPVPRGIFAGARRFLTRALEGIALDRRQRLKTEIPVMAGISNLTIALGVLHRLAKPRNLEEVEAKFNDFLQFLQDIEDNSPRSGPLVERARTVKAFFEELRQQGNRARHAAFARAEAPQA